MPLLPPKAGVDGTRNQMRSVLKRNASAEEADFLQNMALIYTILFQKNHSHLAAPKQLGKGRRRKRFDVDVSAVRCR